MNSKLKVGIVTNCPGAGKTGLARNIQAILEPLYASNKYEIFFLAQGMNDNDPNFTRLPFKVEGAMKNFDQHRFSQDQGYQRHVAYGNTAIEKFVIDNRLDCLILSDDPWAFSNESYIDTAWFKHMENNILPIITADSEPLLPQIIQWAEKCKNMRFWSTFAAKRLKEKDPIKFQHCDTITGAIRSNDFKPLPKSERLELRRKFGISDDEKIIIYLGRNQLRKIFGSHIEGLAKFKKRHPDKKLRLLFHCSWSEGSGWPLNLIREQNGLDKEDILTTYYCRHCGDWIVKPFEGEELKCNCCNHEKAMVTAGVGSTITEKDLNKIYNIADGSASIFTSGGLEFTNIESILAGLPLAVPNYVCGEDFIDSGFVYEIRGTYTFEHQTGFKKFVPNINSVCDFFEYVYELNDDERKLLVSKARAWAIERFDANNVVKKYEEFLDSRQKIDWESFLAKKQEVKNLEITINNQEFTEPNDSTFVINMYKKILNMDVDEKDSGFQHWTLFLKQPKDKALLRRELISAMRNAALEHNAKVNKIGLADVLDSNDKERVLLVVPESLGDCYIITSLLPELQEKYKNASIYIATNPKYFEVFEMNQYVKKCIPYSQEFENELLMTGHGSHKGLFNTSIHVTLSTQRILNYISSKY